MNNIITFPTNEPTMVTTCGPNGKIIGPVVHTTEPTVNVNVDANTSGANIADIEAVFGAIEPSIDFDVIFEPTKAPSKKYAINGTTGEYLDTVGTTFNCASHPSYFRGIQSCMIEEMSSSDLEDVICNYRTARNNAWAMMDITFPNSKVTVRTPKHESEICLREIALHGIDGSCSNQVFFGGIDFFCTNGQISGDWDKVRRKNTSGFVLERFIDELRVAKVAFYKHGERLQGWADTRTGTHEVQQMLTSLLTSKSKAEKMLDLYHAEVAVRGANKYALYSAFTNYATYADDRNGFGLRSTGNDTANVTMWNRENEVSKWISSPQFLQLAA